MQVNVLEASGISSVGLSNSSDDFNRPRVAHLKNQAVGHFHCNVVVILSDLEDSPQHVDSLTTGFVV